MAQRIFDNLIYPNTGTWYDAYGLPVTGQTTVYRAGDDGHFQTGLPDKNTAALIQLFGNPDSATRFVDNGDGTVTDNVTGLMWVKDAATAPGAPFNAVSTWSAAIDDCLALNYAGHTDWRLPNVSEVLSIVDYSLSPIGPPAPLVIEVTAWTSTTKSNVITHAWSIALGSGSSSYCYDKTIADISSAYPVRGGVYNNNTP